MHGLQLRRHDAPPRAKGVSLRSEMPIQKGGVDVAEAGAKKGEHLECMAPRIGARRENRARNSSTTEYRGAEPEARLIQH